MARRFEKTYPIRFAHCDPAGIVFFPQYLVLLNGLVEDWFNEGLGIAYADVLGPRRLGLPIVRLECDFLAISRMGDSVAFGLGIERLGRSSFTLSFDAHAGGERRIASRQVLVCTSLDTHRAVPMPDDLRAAMAAYATAQA